MPVVSKASRRSTRSRPNASRTRRANHAALPWPLLAVISAIGGVAVVALLTIGRPGASSATPWSRLGTEDVHSLAFVGEDPSRLLFGHHGGISASSDGGRSWQTLGTRADAMSLGTATDGSIVIAGHQVFAASRDGGRTWDDIPANLPSLDIHGFTRDAGDPARMWAYLATGGLWKSEDGGDRWERVQEENVLFPVAAQTAAGTRLFGVTANGLAASDDGGRTWRAMTTPEIYPIASLAATADGAVLVAAGADGLARSMDGGATWSKIPFEGQPAAVAVTAGGHTIALVTRSSEFYRSDDGGKTWPGS